MKVCLLYWQRWINLFFSVLLKWRKLKPEEQAWVAESVSLFLWANTKDCLFVEPIKLTFGDWRLVKFISDHTVWWFWDLFFIRNMSKVNLCVFPWVFRRNLWIIWIRNNRTGFQENIILFYYFILIFLYFPFFFCFMVLPFKRKGRISGCCVILGATDGKQVTVSKVPVRRGRRGKRPKLSFLAAFCVVWKPQGNLQVLR